MTDLQRSHTLTQSPRRLHGDTGASLVEYALLVALIAVVCIGAVTAFGSATSGSITRSNNSMITPN
jgi:Flp pilus assembly pilin Flp